MEFLIQDFFLSLTSVMVQLELLTCFSECGYKKKKKKVLCCYEKILTTEIYDDSKSVF